MANNIRELRVAFLLTPRQLAGLLGVGVEQYRRIEGSDETLSPEWIDAVARVLDVPASAVTDPSTDIKTVVASARPLAARQNIICRVGARFAIQAMVAKLGGMTMALDLSEDDLATAVHKLVAYVEAGDNSDNEKRQLNRLSQSLQIAVLTILQSRGVDPGPRFPQTMAIAREGALALLQSFARIDQMARDRETG